MEALFSLVDMAVALKQFKTIKQAEECRVPHLLFADDILIFSRGKKPTLIILERMLQALYVAADIEMKKNLYASCTKLGGAASGALTMVSCLFIRIISSHISTSH